MLKKISLIVILFIFGCSKNDANINTMAKNEIKVFKNKNIPSNENFNVNLKKVFEISGNLSEKKSNFSTIEGISVSNNGDIFILDEKSCTVKKNDKDGNFLMSFGRKGYGPGEFINPSGIYNNLDTIFVISGHTNIYKLDKFTVEGKFIESIKKDDIKPSDIISSNGSIYGVQSSPFMKKNSFFFKTNIVSFDHTLTKLKTISSEINEINVKKGVDLSNFMPLFAVSNKYIYVAKKSDCVYEITSFDLKGNKKEKITKSYRKIKFSDKEIKEYKKELNLMTSSLGSGLSVDNKIKLEYKKSINHIFCDNFDRLWVQSSTKSTNSRTSINFDIFEGGMFLNTVYLDLNIEKYFLKIYIIGNKLFAVNQEENIISVYTILN